MSINLTEWGYCVSWYASRSMDTPFTDNTAGQAFLIDPKGRKKGPGILVLHSWWGLNEWTKDFCARLTKLGYTVLAPDMLDGKTTTDPEEGERLLAELNPDELSGLVVSSAQTLRAASADPNRPIATVGFSMGASMAFWLSVNLPHNVNSVVAFYGTQAIDFDKSNAKYLGHYGDSDHMVSADERVSTESFIRLGGRETEFHTYEGAGHWFFEDGENYNEEASKLAWARTVNFLAEQLPVD